MKITVVGGGNIGTQFMVHCAEKGHEVVAYTSKPELFSQCLNIVDENGKIIHEGNIKLATDDPVIAFSYSDFIMVTYPPSMMKMISEIIYEYSSIKAFIGVVPGNGGSECAFAKCIERGNVFFGLERVPAISRIVKKGETVRSVGYRDELHIASIPSTRVRECCELINGIYDMPCIAIPNFLNLTMTPSNPILHTTRLRTIFNDYHHGVIYDKLPLFYEEWDDESSKLLIACDVEVQKICSSLPEYHLEYVKSLREHYESPTVDAMTRKLSSIVAFKGLTTPAVEVKDGYIPDLHSRYFTSDFSYGLTIIKQIADIAGVSIPNIDSTMVWYDKIAIEHEAFCYSDYGINSKETLVPVTVNFL